MDSITSLRLKIDSTDVTKAQKELDGLTSASGRAEKGANATASSFSMLGKVLTAGAVIGVTAQYIKLADTMTGMTSKLKLVTNSTAELTSAQEELFKIAQITRQGYAETVDTYSNFAVAMGEMGKSQKEILRVTETVNKAIAISGGTAQQAAAATMQLGQAFASGTLRGDELNSILENSKGLAKAIADGMGVPIGQLRKLGSEGKITAEILAQALENSAQSVDDKFSKVGATVSASVTTMENSILRLVGTADQAMNGSGGIAEVFTYFAKSMDDNNETIIESGKDAFRALQVMGVGMIQLGGSFYATMLAIPTAIALAIDASSQLMENSINNMIGLAEDGTNRIKSLYGGDRVKLGRVDIDTNLSQELLDHYQGVGDLLENAKATQSSLFKDIMGNTTELKKIAPPSDKGSGKKGGAGAELTKEQKDALKKAQKLAEEEAKIQRGYLESYADLEAQQAIEQYEYELTSLNDLAARQAQSAIAFYEMTRTEKDKINEENLALYEANAGLFNDEQMQIFFTKWQESIEGVKGGYNEIEGIVSSFVEESLNSKDWTAGLTGTNKALANVGNAYKDIQKQTVKYDKAVKKVNESNLTDEEKKIELKKIEEAQLGAEIGAYANLAGAMSGFFEEGSKGAEAMTAVSATLGIAQGIQAMISAWGSAPFPLNMPAVAATTAAVLPMIGQLTGMGGSGGGGGVSSSEGFSSLSKTEQIERQYDPMIDRLDKQIELLESIDKNGSAQALNVAQSAVTFERDLRVLIEESFKTIKQGGTLAKSVSSISASSLESGTEIDFYAGRRLNKNTLRDMGNFLTFASTASQNLAYFAGRKDFERQISLDTFITNVQEVISDFALSMGESVSEMSDAKDTFKTVFDDITGTTYYATLDLVKAYGEVNNLVGDKDLPTYLKDQITAIETVEDAFGSQIENILNMSNDFKTQVEATQMLNRLLGTTFEAGTAEALNYIESIELVGDKMVQVREDVKSVFENIQDFIDDLTDTSIQNPSVTFGVFSESFNAMIDAISSGSEDMIDISGKAMDNARSYIDVVTATATSSRDIEFAKAIMVNKFSGVIATPDLTLNNINNTLNNNNALLVAELQALKFELNSIKNMTIDQVAATQSSLVSLRGILGEVSA